MLNFKCWKQPILTGLDEFFGNDHICNILFRELIYRAAREDKTWTDKRGKTFLIKRGQAVFGRNAYAMHLGGHNDTKVERALNKLEKVYKLVSRQANHNSSIVELLNYEELVHFEQANEQATDKQRTSSEQAADTSKSVKSIETERMKDNISKEIGEPPKITEEDNILLSEKKLALSNKLSDEQKIASKQEHKQMIDDMLVFLQNKLKEKGIANFKNDNETLRRRVWNIIQMVIRQTDPLPREELLRRLNIILNDPHKLLNCWLTPDKEIHKCNDIDRLFEAIKGFVEPNNSKSTSDISIY